MSISLRRLAPAAAACAALAASLADASPARAYATYVQPLASDPLTGIDRLEITWNSAATAGTIGVDDLSFLEFVLYGPAGAILSDLAVARGATQELNGVDRSRGGVAFSFDLDAWNLDRHAGLLAFDNNVLDIVGTGGAMLDVSGLADQLAVALWIGGGPDPVYAGAAAARTYTIPSPATAMLLGSCLMGLAGLGLRRRPD